ncbi:MAG: hypothetical protein INR73_15290 [Williamsia sp.]|nr:hypothetical protein [Williamsia sp.]
MTTTERIEQLSDFKSLRLYTHISNLIYDSIDADMDTLIRNMPPEIAATAEMKQIANAVDSTVFEKALDSNEAVAFARESLAILASLPATSQLVTNELDNWKDGSMLAETILAVGGAISLVMLLATSEITYDKKNGLKVGIGSVKDKEQVDARRRIIESLFKVIPNVKSWLGRWS